MNEIDLIPASYRRALQLRRWLRWFAIGMSILVIALGGIHFALGRLLEARSAEIAQLEAALARRQAEEVEIASLSHTARQRSTWIEVLKGLRGTTAATDLFPAVEAAAEHSLWFSNWKFRRAGEVVENRPESVRTGYFIVLPLAEGEERERAWLMNTHIEISGQAGDHSILAQFVNRLVQRPEIDEVRILDSRRSGRPPGSRIQFELAASVGTSS